MKDYQVHPGVRVKLLQRTSLLDIGAEGVIEKMGPELPQDSPFDPRYDSFMIIWEVDGLSGARDLDGKFRTSHRFDALDELEATAGPLPGGYWHREAFALMMYECEVCHVRERIWNSRDGVTPFSMNCENYACNDEKMVPMRHLDWQGDQCDPEFQPERGTRIFLGMPKEVAMCYARIRWDQYVRSCNAENHDPHCDAETGIQSAFDDLYKDGEAPWVATL